MIRTQEMVPDWYIEKSRDFQVLCRLFDYNLNSLKYNINTMQYLTDTKHIKDTALPLTGDKFGIYDKASYSNRQLLQALPAAIKNKGSMKSVNTLLNAFLDSMEIFEYAAVFDSKDETSAKEIAEILRRKVRPYSIIIVLSSFPGMTNLAVLDTYLKMVIPTGLIVEYAFGTSIEVLDKFKYKEYVFMLYTHTDSNNFPYISNVANSTDKYSATYDSQSRFIQEVISDIPLNTVTNAAVGHREDSNA